MGRGEDKDVIKRQEASQYKNLFEKSGLGTLLFSDRGRILDANTKAAGFLAHDKESLLQLYIDDLLLQPYSIADLKKRREKITPCLFAKTRSAY